MDPMATAWTPAPAPGGWSLLVDAAARTMRAVGHGVAMLARPWRMVGGLRIFLIVIRRSLGEKGAPRTSLNGIVRAGRRVRFARLDLAAMKDVGHAQGGTVNDVVLALWAGGLRRLLLSRGEPIEGVEPVIGLAVSTRERNETATIDNQVGTIVLRLPAWEPDPSRRLERIVELTREAKARRRLPAAIMQSMAWLSATPLGRYLNLHQRAVNTLVTNVVGPTVPMVAFGARILDVVPIIQLVGNIGLTLCAFSYAGRVALVVTADAYGFPDVDVLMGAMEDDWRSLVSRLALEPVAVVAPPAPREPPLVAPRQRGRGAAPCR
jgi:WS/DGAT/MGAT family acyltransferase